MKTSEVIGYGLLAYLGYKFLIKPHQTTTVVTPGTGLPVSLPAGSGVNPAASSPITAITAGVGTLFKQLFPSAPNPANAGTPVVTPVSSAPATTFTNETNQLFPAPTFKPIEPVSAFTNPNAGIQTDTSGLFTSTSPFSTDTAYLQSLEEADMSV